ncbi:hypothetical protein GN157_01735, partial [Flavobacterium rakeshii]
SATIDVTGGTGAYTYLWDDINAQTTATATGLTEGTYSVVVTDANNCTYTHNFTITEPDAITATAATTQVDVLCNGAATGSATIDVTGGTGAYTYLWDDSNAQTTATATGLTAGTYSVVVTDVNNCTYTHNFTITEPDAITATAGTTQVDVVCYGEATGSATIDVTGGTGTYTYLWNTGDTTATISGLTAGTYTVDVTDVNGCVYTHSFTITEVYTITATAATTQVDVLCNGAATGSATIDVTGGTGTYTYLWNTNETTATISGLTAGTYSVVVTDSGSGCNYTHTFTINEPTALAVTSSFTDVLCNGESNGTATVAVTGGTGTYTYLWDNGQTSATATGLAPGDYTVTVTDANGCLVVQNFTIDEPDALEAATGSTHNDVSCNGGADGEITVVIQGGVTPYSYAWSDGQTAATATGLSEGNYTVTISDANGCTLTENFTISQPDAMALTSATVVNDAVCNGGASGLITVDVQGGIAPYSYLWDNGQTTATATGLVAGTYTVDVTDANGCVLTESFTVNEPTALSTIGSQSDVVCNGENNGEASVVVSGGVAPYTFEWSTGETTDAISGLAAGTYFVTVTDDNGCIIIQNFNIGEPPALIEGAATTQVNVLCNGAATGEINLVVEGGVTPYTYLWNDGQTTASLSGLTAGTYNVEITDDNGCVLNLEFEITQPDAIVVTDATMQSNVTCNGTATGEATIDVEGGIMPYTYLWSNGEITSTITGLVAGTYTVDVTDANG